MRPTTAGARLARRAPPDRFQNMPPIAARAQGPRPQVAPRVLHLEEDAEPARAVGFVGQEAHVVILPAAIPRQHQRFAVPELGPDEQAVGPHERSCQPLAAVQPSGRGIDFPGGAILKTPVAEQFRGEQGRLRAARGRQRAAIEQRRSDARGPIEMNGECGFRATAGLPSRVCFLCRGLARQAPRGQPGRGTPR